VTILGIDASYTCTGIAVVAMGDAPGTERVLTTTRVRTSPRDGTDTYRARNIAGECVSIARVFSPQVIGLEMPYLDPAKAKNASLRLSRLGAIIEAALADAGYEVVQVAAATTGSMLGIKPRTQRADRKAQAIAAVARRYGVEATEDEADAIGVALGAFRNHRREAA